MKAGKREKKTETIPKLSLLAIAFFSVTTLALSWKIASYLLDERRSRNYWDELQDSVAVTDERTPGKESKPGPTPNLNGEAPAEETQDPGGSGAEKPEVQAPENGELEAEIPSAIDFDRLRAISGDAVAWLLSPGTKINYAVAQAEDNAYYLSHLLDGTAASGGSLFADYRCGADFSDWNTVIYGHYMNSGAMFGELMNYRDPAYYEEHPVMYLYVPEKRYKLELIAGYTTDVHDIVYSFPVTKEGRNDILARVSRKSSFLSGVTVDEDDKLVTLSTCSYAYDNARYVVIARLVEM